MKNMKRIHRTDVSKALAEYYVNKFAKETGNPASEYAGKIWVSFDEEKRMYCVRGESLPAHPDMRATYQNGWSLLDYDSPAKARELTSLSESKMPATNKRIHKVVIKRMIDESPDTSWLGEYGRDSESDYSIDREHDLDCPQQPLNAKSSDRCMTVIAYTDKLERAIAYLNQSGDELTGEAFDDALTILGDAQDAIQEDANACTCGGHYLDRNSYQFFNPNYENYLGCTPEEIRKYCLQDYAHMESLNRGDFCLIGIRAEASYSVGGSPAVIQELSSGGLWGIESDSSPEYLESIEQEELGELRKQLTGIGFSSRAISAAYKTIERMDD